MTTYEWISIGLSSIAIIVSLLAAKSVYNIKVKLNDSSKIGTSTQMAQGKGNKQAGRDING